MVISPQRHLIWSQEISGTTFSKKKKKNCIKNIFILRKYIFLYVFHVFFAHCLKYENNKKTDKTKLQSSTNLFFKLSQKKILKNLSVKVKKIKKLLEI